MLTLLQKLIRDLLTLLQKVRRDLLTITKDEKGSVDFITKSEMGFVDFTTKDEFITKKWEGWLYLKRYEEVIKKNSEGVYVDFITRNKKVYLLTLLLKVRRSSDVTCKNICEGYQWIFWRTIDKEGNKNIFTRLTCWHYFKKYQWICWH